MNPRKDAGHLNVIETKHIGLLKSWLPCEAVMRLLETGGKCYDLNVKSPPQAYLLETCFSEDEFFFRGHWAVEPFEHRAWLTGPAISV